MTSIINSEINVTETPLQLVRFTPSGRLITPLSSNLSGKTLPTGDGPIISLYQSTSGTEFDPRCHHSLLLSSAETSRNPFFHQACVYIQNHEELYTTSNLLQSTSSGSLPVVLISRIKLVRNNDSNDNGGDDKITSVEWQKLRPPPLMAMPAGATQYAQGIVFCSQGNLAQGTGGLYYMPRGKPPEALVTGFYGRDFNSPHDVALTRDGALWFTDPRHGFEQEFRGRPSLPCHVYRYHPGSGDVRVVEDGLRRPTGIAFSPDESTVYITDTDAFRSDGTHDVTRAATVYAYDVVMRANSPFLCNRRVFAVPISGVPIGVQCDDKGYVYAGCADGIEIWNSGGLLQAVIEIPGGVTNFCFGKCDDTMMEMFVCAEQRLWRLRFGGDKDTMSVERPGWMEWSNRTTMITAVPR